MLLHQTDCPITGASRPWDEALVSPEIYANPRDVLQVFRQLRKEDPLHWTAPGRDFPNFWAVTRHADVLDISRKNDLFLSVPLTTLITKTEIAANLELTGRTSYLRTLVHMDKPDHAEYRKLAQPFFHMERLKAMEPTVKKIARELVDRMAAMEGRCDFSNDIAVWFPLRVVMSIVGIPEEEHPRLLSMTQAFFAFSDPTLNVEKLTRKQAMDRFFEYFEAVARDRQARPRDDLASVLANACPFGQPISDHDLKSYYLVLSTAGHDTTSYSLGGGLLALIEHPEQMAKLKGNIESHIDTAVEEIFRWVSPIKQFVRTPTQDVEIRGRKVRAGEHLALFYQSANNDEDVFEAPDEFRVDRSPNRHLAFGMGAHVCIGQMLARMQIKAFLRELLPRLESIELDGQPEFAQAILASGIKHLPVRYRFRH